MMFIAFILAVLTTASQLSDALTASRTGEKFDLEVTIASDTRKGQRDFAAEDRTGAAILSFVRGETDRSLPSGTRIRASGTINTSHFGHIFADCERIDVIGRTPAPAIRDATIEDILSGRYDARPVKVSGTLKDYFSDEIDPVCTFLILSGNGKTAYATYNCTRPDELETLDSLIGREVTVSSVCDPRPSGMRRKIGRILRFNDLGDVTTAQGGAADPFSAADVDDFNRIQASSLYMLGRRKTAGEVLAVWKNRHMLIHTFGGAISRIDLAKAAPPQVGETVEVVGFPETDLYRLNFSRAIWRRCEARGRAPQAPVGIRAGDIFARSSGTTAINADLHGKTVKIRGTVRLLPGPGDENSRISLECDGCIIPVDVSAAPDTANAVPVGSVIEATGIYVTDVENWRPNLVFPHIKEVVIVTRTPQDIFVVRRPPWWTPARLMIVISSLLAVIIGILVWSRSLQSLARKRGKALADEELERLAADLKVCERTRLAVELHDSIAQNLTGVSMELDTALRVEERLPPDTEQHLNRALRTIDSCRSELRNCLWDLRSQALEEEDMNKAILLTLSQTMDRSALSVRFNVPRSRFTDNTAHTILRIIRELAANAVRHGKATELKIAGTIENDKLTFSVRDNGCGFDPCECPGVLDGHFGLQGIRERVASLEGDMQIESSPGCGTRVVISINAPPNDDERKI